MSDIKTNRETSKKGTVGASAVGAGSGTLVVIIANTLPESAATLKSILLHVSPTLAIISSSIFAYISYKIVKYFYDKDQKIALTEAKTACHESLKNSETSKEHKEKAKRSLEQIEQLEIQSKFDNLKAVMNNSVKNKLP